MSSQCYDTLYEIIIKNGSYNYTLHNLLPEMPIVFNSTVLHDTI